MECNQGQGFTACGVDALMVVCTYDPAVMGSCLHDSGPCVAGMAKQGSVGECQGRSQYTAHLPSEKETRPTLQYQQARIALSIAVEALCNMTYDSFNDRATRGTYFHDTISKIREAAGDIRLTSMQVECAWCDTPMGEKEGNGSTGLTSTICPACLKKQMAKTVPEQVRRIAAAVGLAIGEVVEARETRRQQIEDIYTGLGLTTEESVTSSKQKIYEGLKRPERGEPAEVAASTGPCMVGIALEG